MIKLVIPFQTITQLPHGDARPPLNIETECAVKALLHISYEHTRSSYGLGVVLNCDDEIFDGAGFRSLRDNHGAWIETDDVASLCGALGVPANEVGIVAVGG
jgi:hypothetical protein